MTRAARQRPRRQPPAEGAPRPVTPNAPATDAAGVLLTPDFLWHPPGEPLEPIIARLEAITRLTGHRKRTVFVDWVTSCDGVLRTLPLHLRQAARGQPPVCPPPDTPADVQQSWRDLRARYGARADQVIGHMAAATWALCEAAETAYADWLGTLFMRLRLGNTTDQYFTPWNIAYLGATMAALDHDIHAAVLAALEHPDNATGQMVLALMPLLAAAPADWRERFWHEVVLPAALPHLTPVTCLDSACGSGAMLLAAAASAPVWAVKLGIVQFYGVDVDPVCCLMARVQMALYGLNGYAGQLTAAALALLDSRGATVAVRAAPTPAAEP